MSDEAIHDSTGLLRYARNDGHVLDRWIIARLTQLTADVTAHLDSYRITEAGRAIAEFITDLSTWYVRRSRERMKSGEGLDVLRRVLDALARLMAPFTPFLAESLWRELGHATSVHLEDWPSPSVIARSEATTQSIILSDMSLVRSIASLAHEQRAMEKIPVRQPLATLTVHGSSLSSRLSEPGSHINQLIELIKDETNVRNIVIAKNPDERRGDEAIQQPSVKLDTTLTPELRREGHFREIIRAVNDLRKQARLTVADRIVLMYESAQPEAQELFAAGNTTIKDAARADQIAAGVVPGGPSATLVLDGAEIRLTISKL